MLAIRERFLHRIIRSVNAAIILICVFIFSCCAPRNKPDEKMEQNWIVIDKGDPFPSVTLAADILAELTTWELEGVIPYEAWVVVEDVQPTKFRVSDLKLVPITKGAGDMPISGSEMRRRAVMYHGNLGLVDAKYLLAHQTEIPVAFQDALILFPGTVLQSTQTGEQVIPFIFWRNSNWSIGTTTLLQYWFDVECVLSPK